MSNSILNMFGCCGERSLGRDRKNKKALLQGPTSTMNLHASPGRPFNRMYQRSPDKNSNTIELKDEAESQFNRSILQRYPMNEVFVLGSRYKIVALLTKKKFSKDSSIQTSFRGSLSSLIKESIKNNSDSNVSSKFKWSSLVKNCASLMESKKDLSGKESKVTSSNASEQEHLDNLGSYLASRLKCDMLVDVDCNFEEVTKYFGSSCNFVLAFRRDHERLLAARKAAEVQDLSPKFDFINANFANIKEFSADIVLLEPIEGDVFIKGTDANSQEEVNPAFVNVIAKALKIANGSFVLKLPGNTNIEELPKLFHDAMELCASDKYKRYCIEIEEIIGGNQEVENVIVYFGDCSIIESIDEYGAIYDYLSSTQRPKWRFKFPVQVVTFILEKVGARKSLKYISEIEELFTINMQFPNFFDIFLDKAISENILTKQEIAQLIKEESKRPSSFMFSIANSYVSKFTLLEGSNSVYSQEHIIEAVEESKGKKDNTKGNNTSNNKKRIGKSISEMPFEGRSQFHSQDNTTQPSHKDNQNKSSNGMYHDFAPKKPFSFKDLAYGDNSMISQDLKPSYEVSHLENYLSSDDGDMAKEYNFKISHKKNALAVQTGLVTPDDWEITSPGLLPGHSGRQRSPVFKPSKWTEHPGEFVMHEETYIGFLEDKENTIKNGDGENNKGNFVINRKNVFLENVTLQGE